MRYILSALVLLAALAACDSSTGPGNEDVVSVKFRTVGPSALAAAPAGPSKAPGALGGIPVEGSNGTLELEGLWMIVAEFELKGEERRENEGCPGMDGDDCHEFEAPPFFVELPLEDGFVSVATDQVPPGVYDRFEFEIEDLDDGDEEDGRGASELMAQIRAIHPDWPEEASLLVVGTFTPEGGEPQPFRVYVDGEIEIERDLDPPLVVGDDETVGAAAIVVEVNPRAWFQRSDGTVLELSDYDFGHTGHLLELGGELEHGFLHFDVEDDD